MKTKPEVVSGLLGVFLRAVETTIRQRSPGAIAGSRFGAVAFVHRFGGYLISHIHYHVLITDSAFSASEDGEAEFHSALDLDDEKDKTEIVGENYKSRTASMGEKREARNAG